MKVKAMLKSLLLNLVVISVMVSSCPLCFGQDGSGGNKKFMLVPDENGDLVRVRLPSAEALSGAMAAANTVEAFKSYNNKGYLELLESFDSNYIGSVEMEEVLPSQKVEIQKLLSEYREKLKNLPASDSELKLKVTYARKLAQILLPNQLEALGRKFRGQRLFLSFILFSRKSGVDLTKTQRQAILQDSKRLHDKIEEFEKMVAEKRKEFRDQLHSIYEARLSKEQKAIIDERMDVQGVVKNMSLDDLKFDTDVVREKK